jgi:hypothetical protein
MAVTGYYDLFLSLEAGILSIFGSLLISQVASSWKDKSGTGNHGIWGFTILLIGTLIYWQFVAISAYVVGAQSITVASSRLREIVVALHNWHGEHQAFPAVASYAADGKPLLSWRVHLLPYLGQNALFQQFRLDEPWDSPHNVLLLPKLPERYRMPQYGRQAQCGGTFYQLIVGPGAVFELDKQATFPQISARRRTDSTIILGVALEAVPWTKPADLLLEENRPLILGKVISNIPTPVGSFLFWWNDNPIKSDRGCRIAFADGSIRSVSDKHLSELKPFILWRSETPNNIEIFD